MISEFSIIEQLAGRNPLSRSDVVLGIGDDGALTRVPGNCELVLAIDTLVEGVHFRTGTDPVDLGYKALAVNLSDLAAMGAEPAWATLALTMPAADDRWIDSFAEGFFSLAAPCHVQLIGGDVTRGPLAVSVQAHGFVPQGAALRRSGARPGDRVFVTGTLGDAAMGLWLTGRDAGEASAVPAFLRDRLARPNPRLAAGQAMRGLASACIDISDGLLADLGHILVASGQGATIDIDRLPLSPDYRRLWDEPGKGRPPDHYHWPLTGGDDYELCFTVPSPAAAEISERLADVATPYTEIGVIESEPGLRCLHSDGKIYTPDDTGFQHFR